MNELERVGVGDLVDVEEGYARASRAASTLRGYRSDWAEFVAWCVAGGHESLPAFDVAISGYLAHLARAGARVGTMSRRLSSIRYVHKLANLPDPTTTARVVAVWEGIRRVHAAPPVQAKPLMPPELYQVLDACPASTNWKTRSNEASLAGLRDRVLLLLGFVSALRASELAGLNVEDITAHERGRVLTLTRSKSNQHGQLETIIVPTSTRRDRCPVDAITAWCDSAGIKTGPLLRPITRGNRPLPRPLTPDGLSQLVHQAVARAGLSADGYSAHSLRAGFVTWAHLRGATAAQIARQTRHRDLSTVAIYTRIENAWDDNAATNLGL